MVHGIDLISLKFGVCLQSGLVWNLACVSNLSTWLPKGKGDGMVLMGKYKTLASPICVEIDG